MQTSTADRPAAPFPRRVCNSHRSREASRRSNRDKLWNRPNSLWAMEFARARDKRSRLMCSRPHLLHSCIVSKIGCVAKPGKRDFTRRFDLVNDRTLINKPKIEVQYIVADEEVRFGR